MKRKTLALPIRLVNYSDTSQVLTLFTREFGVLEAIAKGAHRERNAFQGPFDLASLWEVVFAERPPERGLSILTEGALLEGFRGLRREWRRWASAAFITEYLRVVGSHGEGAAPLFDLAAGALWGLGEAEPLAGPGAGREEALGQALSVVLVAFEARALRVLGFSAPLVACAECGRPWSGSDRPVFFSPRAGGIVCARCRAGGGHAGLSVPGRAVRALEGLSAGREGPPPLLPGPAPHASARPEDLALDSPRDLEVLTALKRLVFENRDFHFQVDFSMLQYLEFYKP